VYFVPGKHLDYLKIDPGNLVLKEDFMTGHPELLKEFYQTTLKGRLCMCTCIKSLLLCIFFCLLGSEGKRLSLRQKQSKQPITNITKVDLLEEQTASSDSNCEGKANTYV
jgi:hypothetical protein